MKVERKVWNSVRILGGDPLQQRYEKLTNLILSYGGRIHGSQYQFNISSGLCVAHYDKIAVYFEIPIENKEAFEKEEKQ